MTKTYRQKSQPQHKTFLSLTAWLILGSLLAACQTPEIVPEVFSPNASHQEYERSLIGQNLAQTPMGQAWIAAGDPAENPSAINLIPFQEQRLFDPAVPDAAYYLFEGIIGQRVKISILTEAETGYFADLFSLESPDSRAPWYPAEGYKETWSENRFRPVATALGELGSNPPASEVQLSPKAAILGSSQIIMEPREERFYLLRLQPRLLEGGQFNVTVNADPLLSWPVKDSNLEDTWSFFGAPRDGGGRVHHGIDIFAPRGTDLLAADDLYISRIQTRERGGRTVFLEDRDRGFVYYYAHMDDWAEGLQRGQFLPEGTKVGEMGNTGNAITTPPHLHFGIYQSSWRGSLDPWYFFTGPSSLEPSLFEGSWSDQPQEGERELYPFYAQRSRQRISPAESDRDGEPLTAQDKPISQISWGTAVKRDLSQLLLVALRENALGFQDENRRIWWSRS
jgi:hypothetical protein